MNDNKLLELAAKAAGYVVRWYEDTLTHGPTFGIEVEPGNPGGFAPWNPLTDDGDALRLAVAVGINVHVDPLDEECNPVTVAKDFGLTACIERHHSDPFAATRRAITRAAAEIGRSM